MARRVRSSVATCSTVPRLKRKATSAASDHSPMAAAPIMASVMSTFMSTCRPRRLNTAARATYTPPLSMAAPKSHGAASGAAAVATKPATVSAPDTSVAMARGSESQKPRPAGAAAPRRALGLVVRGAPLHRVVPEPADGAEDVRQGRLRGVDGDRQGGRAEVDVRAAHAALPAQRALQLHRAVGAVHAGDVEDAAFAVILRGQRLREVEGAVLVHGERAVVRAVGLRSGAAGEGLHVVAGHGRLVVGEAQEAASDVRLDGVDAVEPQQLAADLVHAAAALRRPRQQQRELDGARGHRVTVPAPHGRAAR